MPTAPSFKNYKTLSEPFVKNNKTYIKVEHPNTHNSRDVRWYTDSEYAKLYGKQEEEDASIGFKNLKKVRGFSNGPIVVIRNVNGPADEAWCNISCARYAVGVGWHLISTDKIPEDIPKHFKLILLGWDEFKDKDDFHAKSPTVIANIIESKMKKGKDMVKI